MELAKSLLSGTTYLALTAAAFGQIVVETFDTDVFRSSDSPTTSISNTGSAGDYLVISLATETDAGSSPSAVSFDDGGGAVGMTLLDERQTGANHFHQVFGIATSALSGDIAVTYPNMFNDNKDNHFGFAFLSGVDTANAFGGFGHVGGNNQSSAIDTGSYSQNADAGDFVILSSTFNTDFGNAAGTVTLAPSDVTEQISTVANHTYELAYGYDANVAGGAYSTEYSWDSGDSQRAGVHGVTINAIPEPSSMALIGGALAWLAIMIRRRRA
jgi:hypothetical protein